LAVGEVLLARKHEVLLLVSEKEIDRKALEGRKGFEVRQLPSMGWPRGISIQTIRFFIQLMRARSFCRALFSEWAPDAVLAMGGFTSAAPIWEAKRRAIPSVIHEANAIPGRANRLLAKGASRVVVGFREAARAFGRQSEKVTYCGTPVRSEVRARPDRAASRAEMGFDPQKKLILVMGGSQGARGLNSRVIESLAGLRGEPVQWVHLTGQGEEERVTEAYQSAGFAALVRPFFAQMQKLYAAADLVIARAGASSVTSPPTPGCRWMAAPGLPLRRRRFPASCWRRKSGGCWPSPADCLQWRPPAGACRSMTRPKNWRICCASWPTVNSKHTYA
jgi:UDP-N-acetylglucosamine--N-acetylmuramyl-(pentapeptide) pyrophosphoryl-undecaprenol N-acetylglucosamine transferase